MEVPTCKTKAKGPGVVRRTGREVSPGPLGRPRRAGDVGEDDGFAGSSGFVPAWCRYADRRQRPVPLRVKTNANGPDHRDYRPGRRLPCATAPGEGYRVVGLLRRSASADVIGERLRWLDILDEVELVDGDLTDLSSLIRIVASLSPRRGI